METSKHPPPRQSLLVRLGATMVGLLGLDPPLLRRARNPDRLKRIRLESGAIAFGGDFMAPSLAQPGRWASVAGAGRQPKAIAFETRVFGSPGQYIWAEIFDDADQRNAGRRHD